MRLAVMLHPPATAKIKHPCRNLQHRKSTQLIPHTAQNCLAASLRLALHPYPLTVPRVPAIQHFALLTFMGALCLSCTTLNARTHRWDIDLRRQWRGKSKLSQGMEKWKANNPSHFSTPPLRTISPDLKCPLRQLDGHLRSIAASHGLHRRVLLSQDLWAVRMAREVQRHGVPQDQRGIGRICRRS